MPKQKNIELKTLDHTANHYYVLAAIINLGIIGIESEKKLPEPLPKNPKLHAFKHLPTRWDEVL